MLWSIPIECLAQICAKLQVEYINDLWATGCAALQFSMRHGGVTILNIRNSKSKVPPTQILARYSHTSQLRFSANFWSSKGKDQLALPCWLQNISQLKHLQTFRIVDHYDRINWEDTVHSLPPTLSNIIMSCSELKLDSTHQLPKSLVYLSLPWNKTMEDESISHLPPTLTHFILRFNRKLTGVGIANLPRNLLHLDIDNCTLIGDADLKSLPQSLQSLKVGYCDKLSSVGMANLPRTLRKLKCPFPINSTHNELATYVDRMPSELQSLSLRLPLDGNIRYMNRHYSPLAIAWTSVINSPEYSPIPVYWPTMLQSLKFSPLLTFSGGSATIVITSNLPSTLTRFDSEYFQIVDADMIRFPPSLLHLNLARNSKLTNACMHHLPPRLRTLNLAANKNITRKGINSLPTSITSLTISGNNYHPRAGYQRIQLKLKRILNSLPPKLKKLELGLECALGDECIPSLPSSLLKLSLLGNDQVTAAGLPLLPPNLKELDMPGNFALGESSIKHMPPSVTKFRSGIIRLYGSNEDSLQTSLALEKRRFKAFKKRSVKDTITEFATFYADTIVIALIIICVLTAACFDLLPYSATRK